MVKRIQSFWLSHKPSCRRLVQLYAAVLYNAYVKGFIKGNIYTGPIKNLCVPGLNCYSCPGAIASCPLGALQNALNASGRRAPFYVLGVILLYGLILGRTICGWLCPFGLIQELLHKIPTPKLRKSRFTHDLSYLKYAILLLFVMAIPLSYAADGFPFPAFCKYICPAGTGEGAVTLLAHSGNEELFSLLGELFTGKFVILVLVLVGAVFIYRVFCRFLCPLGAIYGLFGKIALLGVRVEESACTHCGRCTALCKMDIRHVGDRECIHCGECISVCREGAIRFQAGRIVLAKNEIPSPSFRKKEKRNCRRMIAAAVALVLLAGVLWLANSGESRVEPAVEASAQLSETTEVPSGNQVGMLCPDFTLPLYGGEGASFHLAEHRGKVVLINFWGTSCAPCIAELPYFEKAAAEYGDELELITIHTEPVAEEVEMEEFLQTENLHIPVAMDVDDEAFTLLGGGSVLPMTVVVDREGIIVYNRVKSVSEESLRAILEPLLP